MFATCLGGKVLTHGPALPRRRRRRPNPAASSSAQPPEDSGQQALSSARSSATGEARFCGHSSLELFSFLNWLSCPPAQSPRLLLETSSFGNIKAHAADFAAALEFHGTHSTAPAGRVAKRACAQRQLGVPPPPDRVGVRMRGRRSRRAPAAPSSPPSGARSVRKPTQTPQPVNNAADPRSPFSHRREDGSASREGLPGSWPPPGALPPRVRGPQGAHCRPGGPPGAVGRHLLPRDDERLLPRCAPPSPRTRVRSDGIGARHRHSAWCGRSVRNCGNARKCRKRLNKSTTHTTHGGPCSAVPPEPVSPLSPTGAVAGKDATIRYLAEVTAVWETDDPSVLLRLAALHPYKEGALEARFGWLPGDTVTVVELRAYRKPTPFLLIVRSHPHCPHISPSFPPSPPAARPSLLCARLARHLRDPRLLTPPSPAPEPPRARRSTAAAAARAPRRPGSL